MIVPLSEISLFVLKSVIELFYNGHVMIGDEVKPHIVKALTMLKVGNVVISTPEKHAEQLAQMAAPKTNSKNMNAICLNVFQSKEQ